jgi:tRNA dimethylallyltransferase
MIKALAITGPTASGKTALSLSVAEELGCEIISCDSMQIYKGMDIGTAKATEEERRRAPHHLIDLVLPNEPFSASDYRTLAIECAREVAARGKIPLFVGGTGLYIDALMRCESPDVPKADTAYRDAILANVHTDADKISLYEKLREIDPISAEQAHPNNVRRVIRALEIYDKTGKPKSYFDELSKKAEPPVDLSVFTIDFLDRELLYERIDERVVKMYEDGLAEEVTALYENGLLPPEATAAQAIGYKEIIDKIAHGGNPEDAMEEIQQASRNYAKRQLTWFRRYKDRHVLYADRDGGLNSARDFVAEGILLIKSVINNED